MLWCISKKHWQRRQRQRGTFHVRMLLSSMITKTKQQFSPIWMKLWILHRENKRERKKNRFSLAHSFVKCFLTCLWLNRNNVYSLIKHAFQIHKIYSMFLLLNMRASLIACCCLIFRFRNTNTHTNWTLP